MKKIIPAMQKAAILSLVIMFACTQQVPVLFAKGELMIEGVIGDVRVQKAGEASFVMAVKDQMLSEGDIIRTGDDGFCYVKLEGYGTFSLSPKGELKIDMNQMTGNKLNLTAGSIKSDLKKLPKDYMFEVHTPTSVSAVRGTSFLITIILSGPVMTYVFSGVLNVISNATGQAMDVAAGQMVSTTATGTEVVDPNSPEFAAVTGVFQAMEEQEDEAAGGSEAEAEVTDETPAAPEPADPPADTTSSSSSPS